MLPLLTALLKKLVHGDNQESHKKLPTLKDSHSTLHQKEEEELPPTLLILEFTLNTKNLKEEPNLDSKLKEDGQKPTDTDMELMLPQLLQEKFTELPNTLALLPLKS